MATTETVKIVYEVDSAQLLSSIDILVKLGKITQEDATKMKQMAEAAKLVGASSSQGSAGVDKLNDSLKKTNENLKPTKEWPVPVKKTEDALGNLGDEADDTGEKFVSLKQRLREAKLELEETEEKFGTFSTEALAAREKVGELTARLDDLNRQTKLIEPDDKIKAFTALGQSVVGAFSVATGALQALGAENEEVQKVAQKLQGALNIVQGLQSIIQLKEAYEDIKAVLGFTTIAQNTLTTAQTAGKVATEGAAAANVKFAASLSATGIGAIVVAIGALVGAFLLYSNSAEEAKVDEEALKAAQDASRESTDRLRQAVGQLQVLRGQKTEEQLEKENLAAEATEREIALQKVLGEAISEQLNAQKEFDKLGRGAAPSIREERQARLDAAKAAVAQAAASIQAERDALKASQTFVDEEKKKQDAIDATDKAKQASALADQKAEEAIAKRLLLYSEEQKVRQFSVDLNKEYGATEEELTRQKIFNNQLDQESLNTILKQAEGTKQYEAIQSQLNDKVREEILLRKQLETQLETQLVPINRISDQQDEILKKLDKEIPKRKDIGVTATDLNNDLFKQEEEFLALQQQRIDRAFTIANQVTEIFIDAAQRQNDEEIASLEEKREQGLITEEAYEVKLRQLKRKGAEDQKKAQIFQATMSAAQAILSALTIVADPATKAAAVAFAATVGALNLAKIIATPIPKFKHGTLAVPGYDTGDDSVMAMLRPGEAVIPTETNREYASVIKAIYTKQVSSKELNEFVTNRNMKVVNEPVFDLNKVTLDALFKRDIKVSSFNNTVVKRTGGDMPTLKVKADVDTYQLTRAMAKNKAVELSNSEVLAKALAQEIAKTQNIRRQ